MSTAIAQCWTSISRFHDPRMAPTIETAETYEKEGWDGVRYPDTQSISPEMFVVLSAIAQRTQRIHFSSGVAVPLTRHPAVMASGFAALQESSGGRANLVIGRGDTALAHIGLSPTRLGYLERYIRHLKTYLEGGSVPLAEAAPVMEGAVHGFDDLAAGHFPPASALVWIDRDVPRVPIEVAATGPKAIQMAGRVADRVALFLGADRERIAWAIDLARGAAEQAGRDPGELSFSAYVPISVVDADISAERAKELMMPFVMAGSRFRVMDREVRGAASDHERTVLESIRDSYDINKHAKSTQGRAAVDDEYLDSYAIVGEPAYCLDRLQGIADLGVDRFSMMFSTPDQPEHDEVRGRLVRHILPVLQGR
ncbi:LLM class flavin-dependent oxidoreductase [Salinibacterium sp. ZJ454]|uniref:LLM class flavin-dependent oxidoreductase n=1 Tax=Salinibacterium sp. ZJ454 TaxID=2708339 RepID=UPI001422EDA9|nr:LLM class flavin-dependent oxidoreductase [Salinibacterium sp. ZJ454]